MPNGTNNGIAEAIIADIFENNRRFLPGAECRRSEVSEHFDGQILVDGLDLEERLLILSILPRGPSHIRLEEADKGVSESKTFLVRYQASGGLSKRFVIKVGQIRKIEREADAVQEFAAPMLEGTNSPVWRRGPTKAIIAQEFVGLRRGSQLNSLRNTVQAGPAGRDSVKGLLRETLAPWFDDAIDSGPSSIALGTLLGRHVRKGGEPVVPPDWDVLLIGSRRSRESRGSRPGRSLKALAGRRCWCRSRSLTAIFTHRTFSWMRLDGAGQSISPGAQGKAAWLSIS